ncbi:30S ribosomal protein S11 [Candidatus Acetothermia bacterium]|jgi:small subunit ribosomal protein S11|nr:30S ribosomal protein S11 [Candidatus Acetothermia bacterium]MCI2426393.1 30S ribosomal protein S11 [Candidatus Acetothermia bacterium]MCI2427586.1 30S ribosomal protein S11 [Candidatus Acetothermia bacterium]MCI2428198.1 30S ribosomal protein S11 [Candidatus Acetothermia bacterium]
MVKNIKIDKAQIHIHASFNNTIITLTDLKGNPITWKSPGVVGYKGSRKGTPYAAQMATEALIRDMKEYGVKAAMVLVKGTGPGRQAVIQTIKGSGIRVDEIKNVTSVSYS